MKKLSLRIDDLSSAGIIGPRFRSAFRRGLFVLTRPFGWGLRLPQGPCGRFVNWLARLLAWKRGQCVKRLAHAVQCQCEHAQDCPMSYIFCNDLRFCKCRLRRYIALQFVTTSWTFLNENSPLWVVLHTRLTPPAHRSSQASGSPI